MINVKFAVTMLLCTQTWGLRCDSLFCTETFWGLVYLLGLCVGDSAVPHRPWQHLDRAVWVRVRVRVRVSTLMHDQPSLLTQNPGGGVNKEIPHRWGK